MESDLVTDTDFTIRFSVSLIALPEFSYAEFVVLDHQRPSKRRKTRHVRRMCGHSGGAVNASFFLRINGDPARSNRPAQM
jgi:hypothetical protein